MLIDTNVWSEIAKPRPEPRVSHWVALNFDACILSTIVQAEIVYGIVLAEDATRRAILQAFHDDLVLRIADRLLPFDTSAAVAFGSLRAKLKRSGELIGERDMLIAAHALALDVPLVTRDIGDMARTGAVIIDPWTA